MTDRRVCIGDFKVQRLVQAGTILHERLFNRPKIIERKESGANADGGRLRGAISRKTKQKSKAKPAGKSIWRVWHYTGKKDSMARFRTPVGWASPYGYRVIDLGLHCPYGLWPDA